MRASWIAVLIMVELTAGSRLAAAGGSGIAGRVTAAVDGAPIEGANVLVVAGEDYVASATTDADGRYAIALRPGTYDVLLVSGRSRRSARTTVADGERAVVDGQLGTAPSEVVVLEGTRPAAVPPRPLHFRKRKLLEYSDEAVMSDAWTKAWFLLDLSASGRVTRVKFLKRPGHDLDDIALRAAFALTFDPSRDALGRPTPVAILWSFEWPASSFVLALTGLRTAKPDDVGLPPRPADLFVPCAGSGPMRLGSLVYKGYKDCSRPDLSKAATLPWIDAPR
jgi:hypothetical protein